MSLIFSEVLELHREREWCKRKARCRQCFAMNQNDQETNSENDCGCQNQKLVDSDREKIDQRKESRQNGGQQNGVVEAEISAQTSTGDANNQH